MMEQNKTFIMVLNLEMSIAARAHAQMSNKDFSVLFKDLKIVL